MSGVTRYESLLSTNLHLTRPLPAYAIQTTGKPVICDMPRGLLAMLKSGISICAMNGSRGSDLFRLEVLSGSTYGLSRKLRGYILILYFIMI